MVICSLHHVFLQFFLNMSADIFVGSSFLPARRKVRDLMKIKYVNRCGVVGSFAYIHTL